MRNFVVDALQPEKGVNIFRTGKERNDGDLQRMVLLFFVRVEPISPEHKVG